MERAWVLERKISKKVNITKFLSFFTKNIMSFKISDNKLLKKYTKIWKKVKNILKIKFDSEPVYGDNDQYIKTKIKTHDKNGNTTFQGKNVPIENASCKCLSLIMLYFVVKVKEKYYPQTLLEECKYEIKKNKMENLIIDELETSSSDDETDTDSDNDDEFDNKKYNVESNE